MTFKTCSKCGFEKDLDQFFKDNSHKDKLTSSCKVCYKKYKNVTKNKTYKWNKNNYKINKNKIKDNNKEYYNSNKESHCERMKVWRNNNKKYIKEYNSDPKIKKVKNNRRRKKYQNDPNFKLKLNLRSRLWEMLVKSKTFKSKSALILLGSSIQECRNYLESQFKPEMNWLNHGKVWEIDHIIPCSNFDLTQLEEQQKCFHYTNLRPLFKTTEIAESFGYQNEIGNRNREK